MPMTPDTAKIMRLLVCERTGQWATALRRELAESGLRVRELRSFDDCEAELADAPASFLVLELTPRHLDALLTALPRWRKRHPAMRVAVVAGRESAPFEWLVREAGVVHFLCSPRQLGALARIVLRHGAQVPPPPQSLTQRLWAGLPWGKE
jgi:DNA-binding response OmpR family regulator